MTAYASIPSLIHLVQSAAGVSIDSRDDMQNKVFWALKGPRFDANDFVNDVLKAGALHVVSDDVRWHEHDKVSVVENSLDALQRVAQGVRRSWSCPVLALTGSNGKTTTKELIRDVLATTFHVHATKGNLNNHIGVPLTLLNAPGNPELVVVEMGANHQREIALLCELAEPSHGCITNIGLAHLEGFGGEEGVFRGKKELFDWIASNDGTAFVQMDDPKVVRAAQDVQHTAPIATQEWRWDANHTSTDAIEHESGIRIEVGMEGSYNLPNYVAAWTIGKHFGVSEEHAIQALQAYAPTNHRSQLVRTERNRVLLDAYNANPSSTTAALQAFAANGHERPLLILGDMAELGHESLNAHQALVNLAAALKMELWTVGQWYGQTQDPAEDSSWQHAHFSSVESLQKALTDDPITHRQILVKGSRGMAMEQLMPFL